MRRFWPRDQPTLSRPCSKAWTRALASASFVKPTSTPTVRTRTGSCALAEIAWAANAPPSDLMNSRRLMGFTQGQDLGVSIAGQPVHRSKSGHSLSALGQSRPTATGSVVTLGPLRPKSGHGNLLARSAVVLPSGAPIILRGAGAKPRAAGNKRLGYAVGAARA